MFSTLGVWDCTLSVFIHCSVAVLNKLGCVKFFGRLLFSVGEEREGLLPDQLENSFACTKQDTHLW